MVLTAFGFKVIGKAKNGEEAIEMFKEFPKKPDVIIIDHRMPVKNGIEATKEILQMDQNARIIFASADRSVKALAESMGLKNFLIKPFDNDKLIESIKTALNSSHNGVTT